MSDTPIHIVRIFKPARGMTDLLKEVIQLMVPLVEQNEPDVLKYQFFATQDGIVVSQEMFKNADAAMDHMKTDWFFQFHQKLSAEEVLKVPVETHLITAFAGLESTFNILNC